MKNSRVTTNFLGDNYSVDMKKSLKDQRNKRKHVVQN